MGEQMKKIMIKYKPQILYMLIGIVSTIVDYGTYQLCYHVYNIPNMTSNAIAWVAYVTFSFIPNKIWVYRSRSMKPKLLLREGVAYYLGRGISLIFGTAIMWYGVDYMKWNTQITKGISEIFVVIINYILGFIGFSVSRKICKK
ncbi:MAG: GtrA family protein [Ruminococcaceae bacterium]|nr:GtrA family protein [Oscillospiraceae bacterium]